MKQYLFIEAHIKQAMPHIYCWTQEPLSLREKDFSNSPLEKGDKGGCEAEIVEETKNNPLRPLY